MIREDRLGKDFFFLRSMEEDDLPWVCAIEKLSFPTPWHESTFRGEIYNQAISYPYVIVHKLLKKIIGYIIFWHIKEEVHINNIAIHPHFRRMGIAQAVLRRVLAQVQRQGVSFVTLEVRPSNSAAFYLYRKLGFIVLGIKKDYYRKPQEDALVLGKSLI